MSPKDDPSGKRAVEASPDSGNARRLPLILLVLGLVVLVGLIGISFVLPKPGAPQVVSVGEAAVGGPFRMTDAEGRAVDESILKGRWSAIFFGYTYCPDVCPATLTALGAAKAMLGDQARDLQTVFVSVDPERDTPAQIKAYLESPVFPRPVIGLTGTPEQLAAMAKAYRVYYAKSGEGDGYLMDHVSAVYLMNPEGRFVRLVRPDEGPEAMAQEIGAAMRRS